MKKILFVLLSFTIGLLAQGSVDVVQYVNPLIGTQSSFELSAGNTYPAIALPWGMNFWTPQTGRNGDGWQYTYDAHTICGLKQTHQPSPWINDYGCFSIMPTGNRKVFGDKERRSWFSHKGEECRPYYYSVYLADSDVKAELTPTERAAAFRFTCTDSINYFVLDAYKGGHDISVEGSRITGVSTVNHGGVPDNFANYFVVEFDRPIEFVENRDSIAVVGFKVQRGEIIGAVAASSFISPEQALLNLRETEGQSFDDLVSAGRKAWNDILGRIQIEDENLDNKRTFYSCLYRATLFPRKFYEIDGAGNIVHYSPYNGKTEPGYMYTDTGFWDTFRSLFPLLNLLYPSVNREMQEGFLNVYRESGFFPEWSSPGHRGCMIGNNSASVLTDAWLKGIKVTDPASLWRGMVNGANSVHPTVSSTGREGYDYYNHLGYVPYDVGINENAARTLEYAYNDWCIYRFGKAIGKSDKELAPYRRRAFNYRKLYDKEHKLMRGRNEDGSFATPFSPLKWGDAFTEGNAWHYTWSVFHDPEGLKQLMGGEKEFTAMLDSVVAVPPLFDDSYYGFPIHEIREMTVMNMGNYAHGNQPVQHMIYLYNWTAEPWKAQRLLREVMQKMYTPLPDGYCGDEDNGQTSAWYVFSALGFYPVCPGTDQYVIGSPLFRKATLLFENGHKTVLTAPDNSPETPYVSAIKINSKSHNKNYFTHSQLTTGCRVDFQMSATPMKNNANQYPYSFSVDEK